MSENEFCLVYEPWIPVVDHGRVSLMDIFMDDSMLDIDGNAIQKIALIKLMIAIAQASIEIETTEDWKRIGKEGLAECVASYLEKHSDCFYLYGDKPFLQMPQLKDLPDSKKFRIEYDYIPGLASDNDSILREVQTKTTITDAEKAVFIVTLMNYAMSGKKGVKKNDSVPGASEKAVNKGTSTKPGPSLGAMGYLQTYLKGRSIRETVWLNFYTKQDLKKLEMDSSSLVTPPWEEMSSCKDDHRAKELKESIYAWLVAVSRFVLLDGDFIYYTDGLRYPSVNYGYFEPYITRHYKEKKGYEAVWVDMRKKPWRDLPAILQAVYIDDSKSECAAVSLFMRRTFAQIGSVTIWTGGLRTQSQADEQFVKKGDDYVEAEFFIDAETGDSNAYRRFCETINKIGNYARLLEKAIKKYSAISSGCEGKSPAIRKSDRSSSAVSKFWICADARSQDIVTHCFDGSEDDVKGNLSDLWKQMLSIYDDSCPHDTAVDLMKWMENRPVGGKNGKRG